MRVVFVKNEELSVPGFRDQEQARLVADTIPQVEGRRIKVAFRSRTGTYDVVVKDVSAQ